MTVDADQGVPPRSPDPVPVPIAPELDADEPCEFCARTLAEGPCDGCASDEA